MYATVEGAYIAKNGNKVLSRYVCNTKGGFLDVASNYGYPLPHYTEETVSQISIDHTMCDALDYLRRKGIYTEIGQAFVDLFKKLDRAPSHVEKNPDFNWTPARLHDKYHDKGDLTARALPHVDQVKFEFTTKQNDGDAQS